MRSRDLIVAALHDAMGDCELCDPTGCDLKIQLRRAFDAAVDLAAAIADGADTLVEGAYRPDHPRVAQRIALNIRRLKESR